MCARILVVDDDPVNIELLNCLLHAFQHETLLASEGSDAIRIAKATIPDLVLCDVQMPGVDGFAVLAALRACSALRDTPILAVSALAMVGDREKMLAAGFDGYLAKPIDPETFVPQIEGFLPSQNKRRARVVPETTPSPAHAELFGNHYVLIVDDNADDLLLLKSLLESIGVDVVATATASAALQQAMRRAPALIISDMHMHGISGLELLTRVRADSLLRRAPFVMLSASSNGATRDEALARGADRFIDRPIEPQQLIELLQRYLPPHRPPPTAS